MHRLLLTVTALLVFVAHPTGARAVFDVSGPWYVEEKIDLGGAPGPDFVWQCHWDLVQAGGGLTGSLSCPVWGASGPLSGTIDPDAGTFSLTRPEPFCVGAGGVATYLGTVAADGKSFSGSVSCPGAPPGSTTFTGELCQNGAVDPGEACDGGIVAPDSCCTALCQPRSAGSACGPDDGDGNRCTGSYCDGAGACVGPGNLPAGTWCAEIEGGCAGRVCDGAGSCSGGSVPYSSHEGQPCGGPCWAKPGRCQAGVCSGELKPAGSRCYGHEATGSSACTIDSCQADGSCVPSSCSKCCAEVGGSCFPAYDATCEHPASAESRLLVKRNKYKFSWRWRGGDELNFNDPATNGAALCAYDGAGPSPNLAVAADTATTCGGGSCWDEGKAIVFRDRTGNSAGLSRMRLKPGAGDKARIDVSGRGVRMYDGLPFDQPVRVQLRVGDRCWESTFGGAPVNDSSRYQATGGSASGAFLDPEPVRATGP